MAEIGKSLVFFNQYLSEMNRLRTGEKVFPETVKRRDRKQIRKYAAAVDRKAGEEGRHLLEACMHKTKHRLENKKMTRFVRVNKPKTVEDNWEIAYHVFTPRQRKHHKGTRQIGITLANSGLTPWVWSKGGVTAEGQIRVLLTPGVATIDARKGGWAPGTVPLTTVPIPWALAKDFILSADGFIEQTSNVLEAITPAFIRKLIALPLTR